MTKEKRQHRIARMTADVMLRALSAQGQNVQAMQQAYLLGLRDGFCFSHGTPHKLLEVFGRRSTDPREALGGALSKPAPESQNPDSQTPSSVK